jgi:modification methylase
MRDVELYQGSGARMDELSDGSVSLVMTSPPYFQPEVESLLNAGVSAQEDIHAIAASILRYSWSLRPVFEECARVLMPGGRLVMQTRDVRVRHELVPVEGAHRQMVEAQGLALFTRHLWRPKHVTLARRRMAHAMTATLGPAPFDPEVFLVFVKPGKLLPGEPAAEDIALLERDICVTIPGRLPAGHRFQAPVPMLQALIRTHSCKGGLVVDPFTGGGTALRVAQALGRLARGWEIDPYALKLARINLGLEEEKGA